MIETIQIPLLLKAIDFIFEEGRKILEERRVRRKTSESDPASPTPQNTETPPPAQEGLPAQTIQENDEIREELLTSKIDEIRWRENEMEVQHLVRLLETYSRNYRLASEQYAKWGSALVPPIVVHNLTEAENSVAETLKKLETVLSKVYQKDLKTTQ